MVKKKKSIKTYTGTEIGIILEDIKSDFRVFGEALAGVKEGVAVLKEDVAVLKTDVSILKSDMKEVKTDIKEIRGILKEKADKKDVVRLEARVTVLEK